MNFTARGKNELKHNRTHAGQHIAFRTTQLIGGQGHVENLHLRWHWWNLGTITPWLVSTAAQHPELFSFSLHLKLIVAFLKYGVSSLSSSVLFRCSKGANLTSIHSQMISSNLRGFFFFLKGLNNISSVFWLCWFLFSPLPLLLSWWYCDYWNEFLTGEALPMFSSQTHKIRIPETPQDFKLDRCNSKPQF